MSDGPHRSSPNRTLRSRRVYIVAGVGIAIAVTAVGFWYIKNEQQISAKRNAAIQIIADNTGDLEQAINDLKQVIQRRPKDADSHSALAHALLRRRPGNRSDVVEAVRAYSSALEIDSARITDRAEMVRLFDLFGESEALTRFIDPLIEARPQDSQLYELKTLHLLRLGRAKEAEAPAKKWQELSPDNFNAQLCYAGILSNSGKDQLNPDSFLNQGLETNPNKDLVSLARAAWLSGANQAKEANDLIEPLLANPNLDPKLTRPLVGLLDQLDRRADADRVLSQAIAKKSEASLITLAALRDMDRANNTHALEMLSSAVRPADASTRAAQLCVAAFLARRMNQTDLFERLQSELRSVPIEVGSKWLAVLAATQSDLIPANLARELLPQLRLSALTEDGGILIQLASANCLVSLGQERNADRMLEEAARGPAGWSPCARRLVVLRRGRGEVVQAVEAARFLFVRSGRTIDSAVALALAMSESKLTGVQASSYLQLLREIQKTVPGEVQTLGLYVDAIAKGNDPTARTVLSNALNREGSVPLEFLLHWAELSHAHKLGLEADCIAKAQAQFGLSPRIALTAAIIAHREGRTSEGLSKLRDACAQQPQEKRRYDEAIANYLLISKSPDAAEAWSALAAAYPEDVSLQIRVLDLGFGGNPEQKRALIERIRKVDATNIVAEVADIHLSLQGRKDRATIESALLRLNRVVERAPDLIPARLLLIDTLMRSDNAKAALAQWEKAFSLAPTELPILLTGAQLLVANGNRDRATEMMRTVERLDANMTVTQRYESARIYLVLGVLPRTVEVLQPIADPTRPGQLLLAEANFRAGKNAEGQAILEKLLTSPDFDTLLFAAAVADSQGKTDEAIQLLQRAQNLSNLSDLDRLRVAEFASERGSLERVIGFLAASNVSNEVTIRIARMWVEQGEVDAAMRALNDAASKSADPAPLRRRLKEESQVRSLIGLKLNQVASQLLDTPDDVGTRQMVDFALTTQQQSLRDQQISMDRLATMDESSYALQMFLADRYLAANQPMAAEKHARLAAQANPSASQPLALATVATARAGNTGRCAEAIKDWRNRIPADNTQPDAFEARNLARRQEFSELLARFEPRVVATGGKASLEVFFALAQAMHARGRDADANSMLKPIIESDSRVSIAWLNLVANEVNPASALKSIEACRPIVERRQLPTERVAFAIAMDQAARKSRNLASIEFAEQLLTSLEALASELPIECVVKLAANRVARGELDAAEEIYRKAITSRQDASAFESDLAEIQRLIAKLDDALSTINHAISTSPDVASMHDTRAAILVDAKRFDEALAAAQAAQRLEPLNPRWLLRVATIQQMKGDLVSARPALEMLRWFFREPEAWDNETIERFQTFEQGFTRKPTTEPAAR